MAVLQHRGFRVKGAADQDRMPTLHMPDDRPPRSEHNIGVILHIVAAGHLAYWHVVGRVFFKAVADNLPDEGFSAGLGHPPAGERRVHLCNIRIVGWLKRLFVLLWSKRWSW